MNTAKNYAMRIHSKTTKPFSRPCREDGKTALKVRYKNSIRLLPNIEFTARELDILRLMALGYTSAEAAEELFLSPHTVKTHQKNLLKKTGCKNSTHLVVSCLKSKLI